MTSIAHPYWNDAIEQWRTDWQSALPTRTPEEEARLFEEARQVVAALQAAAREGGPPRRALHAKAVYATRQARVTIPFWIAPELRYGPFQPDTEWPATVRFSSAFSRVQPDESPDQRGLAVRLTGGDRRLDLLTTTSEVHHARDADALLASLRAGAAQLRGGFGAVTAIATLVGELGVRDGVRLARTVSHARDSHVSLAALGFYSRAPFQLGPWAVRYRFAPIDGVDATVHGSGDDALAQDLVHRLGIGQVHWSLQLQGFLDPVRTPMDDHRVAWDSPWVPIGHLTLDPPPPDDPRAETDAVSDAIAYRITPDWPDANGPVLTPLGDLNRIRGAAYGASQSGRL